MLGYVAPWNALGYDLAASHAHKFDLVSPVWYTVKRTQPNTFSLLGSHNVDQGWINRLRSAHPSIRIIPRFQFEAWSIQDYEQFVPSEEEAKTLVTLFQKEIDTHGLDGVVLEHGVPHLMQVFTQLLKQTLGPSKTIVLVVPPKSYMGASPFNHGILRRILACCVDYISLSTYDYSNPSIPGPNAPMEWLEEALVYLIQDENQDIAHKILMGINFYGWDYNFGMGNAMQAVNGKDYVGLLERHKGELKWNKWAKECSWEYHQDGHQHSLWYPTPRSLRERLEFAQERGVGVAVWELGQGLHMFYNQL